MLSVYQARVDESAVLVARFLGQVHGRTLDSVDCSCGARSNIEMLLSDIALIAHMPGVVVPTSLSLVLRNFGGRSLSMDGVYKELEDGICPGMSPEGSGSGDDGYVRGGMLLNPADNASMVSTPFCVIVSISSY